MVSSRALRVRASLARARSSAPPMRQARIPNGANVFYIYPAYRAAASRSAAIQRLRSNDPFPYPLGPRRTIRSLTRPRRGRRF